MNWWVIGLICVGVVLVPIVAVIVWFLLAFKEGAAAREKFEQQGRVVKAGVVLAHNELYKGKKSRESRNAQFVFVLDDESPQLDAVLDQLAEEIRNFRVVNDQDKDERYIAQVMGTQLPYYAPLRIPSRIAGDLDAYTVSVSVPYDLLPEGRLTRPYVYLKVYIGETFEDRAAEMVAYPDDDR